jgi:tetratricopeptide (TPR) repeat protein
MTRDEELARVDAALRNFDPNAISIGANFVEKYPDDIAGLIFLVRIYQSRSQSDRALDTARRAASVCPKDPLARLALAETLMAEGDIAAAFDILRKIENDKKFDPAILDEIGNLYFLTNNHVDAVRCHKRIRILEPTNMRALYRLAHSAMALGNMDEAESLLNDIIRRAPHEEYGAYHSRSTLRKQTPYQNNIAELEKVLSENLRSARDEQILCYALAKELEDLGEWKSSFAYLKRGADAYRKVVRYDVADDIGYLTKLQLRLSEDFFRTQVGGYEERAPFFVLGMPRSGTTLVDRILSSHSEVGSIGESGEFWRTVARKSNTFGRVLALNELDYTVLGEEYCRAAGGRLPGVKHILDKTPANFISVGAIAAALPNAKIFHLRRNPMDSCYAIYKTLFREGCEYSYQLEELGNYYIAYLRLMEHWRRVLPGKLLDVDYEELVSHQEVMTRRMISYAELEWEDACMSFESNKSPSLTASVVQVRQPIYKSSVGMWRNYEEELQPLAKIFRAAGIPID